MSDRRLASLDPEKQRLIEQQILLEQRKHPNQNVEAILARSEQVMEICQGILNGETITPSYNDLDTRPVREAAGEALETEAVTEAEPVKEREEVSEAVNLAAAQPTVTPYMNSAALNEIAGELLITVRELREELLQVIHRNHIPSDYHLTDDRSERLVSGWRERWCSRGSCWGSWPGRWSGSRYSAAGRGRQQRQAS